MNKIQPYIFLSLIWLPLSGPVQLPRDDLDPRAEMGPSVSWNSLLMGLFCLKLCSNSFRRGGIRIWPAELNWHFGTETDLFNF